MNFLQFARIFDYRLIVVLLGAETQRMERYERHWERVGGQRRLAPWSYRVVSNSIEWCMDGLMEDVGKVGAEHQLSQGCIYT